MLHRFGVDTAAFMLPEAFEGMIFSDFWPSSFRSQFLDRFLMDFGGLVMPFWLPFFMNFRNLRNLRFLQESEVKP